MQKQKFDITKTKRTIFEALVDARHKHGGNKLILEDADRSPIDYNRLILSSLILGRKFQNFSSEGETIGLLIANSIGGIAAFFGIMAFGRKAAMLNFTAGSRNIRSACEAAQVKTIITAKRFIIQGKFEGLIEELSKTIRIIYLEDLRTQISAIDKVRGLLESKLPKPIIAKTPSDETAVLLFTSGTEGAPKGVALSHGNLLSNVLQIDDHIDLSTKFIVLNPLPIFHSFGLTGGVLLPLLTGMKAILFPSPLQAKNIVKLIKDTQASVLFATDTFVNQYVRVADEGDLSSLEFVVCGAERVKPETRDALMQKFNVPIIEGYGATEAAPVISVNQLKEKNRPGTVGRFLPNVEWKLESVPGINGGGRLYLKGPNLMMGYVRVDAPGEVQKLPQGWHDTGDIVSIDDEGYISIRGRLKRFAKIGGEMVSLGAVEGYATNIWPENLHVAISINDAKKGEQIVLLTNNPDANRNIIQEWFKNNGINELALPKRIIHVAEIPILGTGKIDYVASQKIAEENSTK